METSLCQSSVQIFFTCLHVFCDHDRLLQYATHTSSKPTLLWQSSAFLSTTLSPSYRGRLEPGPHAGISPQEQHALCPKDSRFGYTVRHTVTHGDFYQS